MDFDMDIERLRRGRLAVQEETANSFVDDGYYRAFRIADTYEPQRRVVIRSANLRRQVIPLYDLLYNIVTDWDGGFLCLIYPFVTIKIYGRHLGEMEVALTYHLCTRIDEFQPSFDQFPEGTDEDSEPIVTRIVIEGDEEDHGMDADAESRRHPASGEQEEE